MGTTCNWLKDWCYQHLPFLFMSIFNVSSHNADAAQSLLYNILPKSWTLPKNFTQPHVEITRKTSSRNGSSLLCTFWWLERFSLTLSPTGTPVPYENRGQLRTPWLCMGTLMHGACPSHCSSSQKTTALTAWECAEFLCTDQLHPTCCEWQNLLGH